MRTTFSFRVILANETIKANLRERMKTAKQFVLLGSVDAKKKGGDGSSFLAYEIEAMVSLGLPVVVANLDGTEQLTGTLSRNRY